VQTFQKDFRLEHKHDLPKVLYIAVGGEGGGDTCNHTSEIDITITIADSRKLAMSATTDEVPEDFAITNFDIFEHHWFRNETYRNFMRRADYKIPQRWN
jgi:hypothetical protein